MKNLLKTPEIGRLVCKKIFFILRIFDKNDHQVETPSLTPIIIHSYRVKVLVGVINKEKLLEGVLL